MKHYLQFSDLNASEYAYLFERAALIKKKFIIYIPWYKDTVRFHVHEA